MDRNLKRTEKERGWIKENKREKERGTGRNK